jgi:hypothetical protein
VLPDELVPPDEAFSRSEDAARHLLARAMVQLVRQLARRVVDVERRSTP